MALITDMKNAELTQTVSVSKVDSVAGSTIYSLVHRTAHGAMTTL